VTFGVILVLFATATVWFGSFSADQPSIPNAEQPAYDYTTKYYISPLLKFFRFGLVYESEFVTNWHDEIIAVGTIFIAAFTIVLGIATQALVREGREASKRQLRAYVGIEAIELVIPHLYESTYAIPEDIPTGGFVYEDYIKITLRNFGQTPSHDAVVTLNWQPVIFGTMLGDDFAFEDLGDSGVARYFIDAGSKQAALLILKNNSDIIVFRDASVRNCSVHFYGHIDYTDAFRTRWRRDFLYAYEPWGVPDARFVPYGARNRERKIS